MALVGVSRCATRLQDDALKQPISWDARLTWDIYQAGSKIVRGTNTKRWRENSINIGCRWVEWVPCSGNDHIKCRLCYNSVSNCNNSAHFTSIATVPIQNEELWANLHFYHCLIAQVTIMGLKRNRYRGGTNSVPFVKHTRMLAC